MRRWCHLYLLKKTASSFPEIRKKTLSLPIYTEENPIPVLLHAYEEMGSMHWGRLMAFISYANRHNLSMQEWNVVYEWITNRHPHAVPGLWILFKRYMQSIVTDVPVSHIIPLLLNLF